MKKHITIIFALISFVGFGQTGIWDSTNAIIYPTYTTGKVPISASDTIYLIDVDSIDAANQIQYINCQSAVKMIYNADTNFAACQNQNNNCDSTDWYKRSPMTINSDSTMLLPERITAIEIWATATDRYSVFGGFPITATMTVVDSSGGGDYTTYYEALAAISATDTIAILKGTYTYNQALATTQNTTVGYGRVKLKSDATTVINCNSNSKFMFLQMDGKGTSTYVIRNTGGDNTYQNCALTGSSSRMIQNTAGASYTIRNSVIHGDLNDYVDLMQDGSTITSIGNYYNVAVDNYLYGSSAGRTNSKIYSRYDKINLTEAQQFIRCAATVNDVRYLDYYSDELDASIFQVLSTATDKIVKLKECVFEVDTMITAGWLYDESSDYNSFLDIEGLYFKCNGISNPNFVRKTGGGFRIDSLITDMDKATLQISDYDSIAILRHSYLTWKYPADNNSSIVSISLTSQDSVPLLAYGNKIWGGHAFGNAYGGHGGLYITNNKAFKLYENEIKGLGLASIIVKQLTGETSFGSVIYLNNCINSGILNRGHDSLVIANNTISEAQTNQMPYGINIYYGDDNNEATGNIIVNNILNDNKYNYNFDPFSASDINDLNYVIDSNIVYGDTVAILEALVITDWSIWQDTVNYESNSFNTNPNLNANYVPVGGDAIGNSSSRYNTRLSSSAIFPNPLTVSDSTTIGAFTFIQGNTNRIINANSNNNIINIE